MGDPKAFLWWERRRVRVALEPFIDKLAEETGRRYAKIRRRTPQSFPVRLQCEFGRRVLEMFAERDRLGRGYMNSKGYIPESMVYAMALEDFGLLCPCHDHTPRIEPGKHWICPRCRTAIVNPIRFDQSPG